MCLRPAQIRRNSKPGSASSQIPPSKWAFSASWTGIALITSTHEALRLCGNPALEGDDQAPHTCARHRRAGDGTDVEGNDRMKIILLANTDWYLYNFRRSLALALQDAGHDVLLLSPEGP